MKNIRFFFSENFQFFGGEIVNIFESACFRNGELSMTIFQRYLKFIRGPIMRPDWPKVARLARKT